MTQRSLSLLNAVIESTADGILVVATDGKIVHFNKKFGEIWRIPDSILESRDDEKALAFVLSQLKEPERFLEKVRELYRKPEASSFDVLEFQDGRVLERYSQPQLLGKEVVGRVWSFRDVTIRVQAENEMKKALQLREDFMSIAAHELRTPLTPLKLQLDLLAELLGGKPSQSVNLEMVLKLIRSSNRQIATLKRLIDDLLDGSRLSTGQMTLKLSSLDLSELVQDAFENFRPELLNAKCEAELHAEPGLMGRFDRLRVEQVVTNLLSNAVKYGAGKPVRIATHREGDRLRLSIKDFGIGIDEKDKDRIFERFERAVSPMKFGGLGLGLFITRQIVETHGGQVHVQSEVGHGATFVVDFPA